MYVVGLNGPPRSGKDSVANRLNQMFDHKLTPSWSRAMIMPCRLVAFAMMGKKYDPVVYESLKDQKIDAFKGLTLREFMISYSEEWLKPRFGIDVYARALMGEFMPTQLHMNGILFISDQGFQEEADAIEEIVGSDRYLTVQLERDSYEWGNDSRYYCGGTNILKATNEFGRLDHVAGYILDYCENTMGWDF